MLQCQNKQTSNRQQRGGKQNSVATPDYDLAI